MSSSTNLESRAEQRFCKEARKLGCKIRKLNGMGHRGWPDRLVMIPGGHTLYVEFKRENCRLSPLQEDWHKEAREMGFFPLVCETWESPLEAVKFLMGK